MQWLQKRIRIEENGCWIWLAATVNSGYGKLKKDGRFWLAHRYIYTLTNREINPNHVICHTCNEKLCVNPEHLKAGTYQENYLDQIENGKSKPVRGVYKPLEYYRRVING